MHNEAHGILGESLNCQEIHIELNQEEIKGGVLNTYK
jgi:hypothetical protein